MIKQACNEFVLILRDETPTSKNEMLIASGGREKPHVGMIHAAGDNVEDKNVKAGAGCKCLFHAGTGFEIEYEGIVYLVLEGSKIIALP
jgi:co-chaperonin GroES (HSP10)